MKRFILVLLASIGVVSFVRPAYAITMEAEQVGAGKKIGTCTTGVSLQRSFYGSVASVRLLDSNNATQWSLSAQSFGVEDSTTLSLVKVFESICGVSVAQDQISLVNPEGTFDSTGPFGFKAIIGAETVTLSVGKPSFEDLAATTEQPPQSVQASPKTAIVADAERSTVSLVSSNRRMTQEARGRFIANLRQTADGFVGRNNVAFGIEGDARASNGQLSTKGSFFQQQGNDAGTYRRLFYGDFDVQKDKGTGSTTATLSGKLAWERMISESTMVGYFIGLDLGGSDIDGTFRGDQKTGGLQLGTYAVTQLDKNIYLDGFLTVGAAKNKLDMTDGTLALDGTYISRMASFGGALTGVIQQDGYELWPELALTIGHTRVGVLDLNSRTAGVVGNTVAVDAGNVTIADLTLRPEVRMAADGRAMKDSRTLATFAPRVICESVKTTATNKDCGFGSEVGFSTRSETGMTIFDAKVILDKVGSSARRALQLKLEHKF